MLTRLLFVALVSLCLPAAAAGRLPSNNADNRNQPNPNQTRRRRRRVT
jgi:hypothetical protein